MPPSSLAIVATLLFGLTVTLWAIWIVIRHYAWVKRSALTMVIVMCISKEVINYIATLTFLISSSVGLDANAASHLWTQLGVSWAVFFAGAVFLFFARRQARMAKIQQIKTESFVARSRLVLGESVVGANGS